MLRVAGCCGQIRMSACARDSGTWSFQTTALRCSAATKVVVKIWNAAYPRVKVVRCPGTQHQGLKTLGL